MRQKDPLALKSFLLNSALAASALALSLLFSEHALGMMGLPAPAQMNPPNFRESRKNIEFEYEFKTNSLGLRYQEIPLQKPAGSRRIYVAGDSFTEGVGLAPEETFGAILEKRYSRPGREVHFINGGLAGAGPREYGDVFLKIGLKYRPDGLLIGFYANDVTNMPPERKNPVLRHFLSLFPRISEAAVRLQNRLYRRAPRAPVVTGVIESVSGEARKRGVDPRRIEEWRSRLPAALVEAADRGEFNGSILSSGLLNPFYWTDSLDIGTPLAESKWRSAVAMLDRVVDECRRRRIETAFVFFPTSFQYLPESFRADSPYLASGTHVRREWLLEDTELQKRCKAWAEKKGIPFIDLTPSLRKVASEGGKLIYPLDGHWNAEGDRTVAGLIGDWLDRERVFSFL